MYIAWRTRHKNYWDFQESVLKRCFAARKYPNFIIWYLRLRQRQYISSSFQPIPSNSFLSRANDTTPCLSQTVTRKYTFFISQNYVISIKIMFNTTTMQYHLLKTDLTLTFNTTWWIDDFLNDISLTYDWHMTAPLTFVWHNYSFRSETVQLFYRYINEYNFNIWY